MKKRLFKNEERLKEILKADTKIIDKLKKENEELKKELLILSLNILETTIKENLRKEN